MALSLFAKSESEKKVSLLEALVQSGAVNNQVLSGIKDEMQNWPELKDLASYLVTHNIVTPIALNVAMAKLLDLQFMELPEIPDIEAMKIIPKDVCLSYQIVAYKKVEQDVSIAVANPARIKENKRGVLADLKNKNKYNFSLVVTSMNSFNHWMEVYPPADAPPAMGHSTEKGFSLNGININHALLNKIPVAMATKYRFVVYGKEGDKYLLATEDLNDPKVKTAISFIEEKNKIKFVVKQTDAKSIEMALGLYQTTEQNGKDLIVDHSVLIKIPKAVAVKYRFIAYKQEGNTGDKPTFFIATDRSDNTEDKRIWEYIEQHNNVKIIITLVSTIEFDKLMGEYDDNLEVLKLPDAKVAKWLLPAPMMSSAGVYPKPENSTVNAIKAPELVKPHVPTIEDSGLKHIKPEPPEPAKTNVASPPQGKSITKSESGMHKVLVSLGLAHDDQDIILANDEARVESAVVSNITPTSPFTNVNSQQPLMKDPIPTKSDDLTTARFGSNAVQPATNLVTPSGLNNQKVNVTVSVPPNGHANAVKPTGIPYTTNPPPNAKVEEEEEDDLGSLLEKDIETVEELQKIITEGFIPRMVAAIVSYAITLRASDIHVEAEVNDVRLRFRIDGMLQDVLRLPLEQHAAIISRIKILAKLKIDETRIPQDGRFDVKFKDRAVDLRVSSMPTVHGEKIVMRILDKSHGIMSLEELGVVGRAFDIIIEAIKKPYGIVLSTGPTGSGKSTTLYAILNRISTPTVNIITLEDPVEYEIAGVNQAQIKPKIGFTFAEGLRSVLRQDPNVVMVGEIRDAETANMATHAALTGHLVLSTLHTNDAPGALPRLINMGVEPFLITSSVNAIMGQRLVRKVCSNCKEVAQIPPAVVEEIKAELGTIPESNVKDHARIKSELVFYHGKGCSRCQNGYRGRIGIYEVMPMSDVVEDLAIKKAAASEIRKQVISEGMITMKQDGLLKALEGLTTVDEVLRETAM